MSSPPRWPRALVVLLFAAGLLALVLAAPDAARWLLAKEGPLEHLSHLVLLAALIAWCSLTRTAGRAAFMAAFLALVLAEEIDWGGVYGLPALGLRLDAAVGHRNLHNAARGSSYLLFAAPLLLYFAAPARLFRRLRPIADERAAFLLIALAFLAYNLGPWERQAQELLEALLYGLLLAVALRLRRPQ